MPVGLGKGLMLGGGSAVLAIAVGDRGWSNSGVPGLTVYRSDGSIDESYDRLDGINVRHLKWHPDGIRLLVTPESGLGGAEGFMVVGPGVVGEPATSTESWWTDVAWSGLIIAGVGSSFHRYELNGYETTFVDSRTTGMSFVGGTIGAAHRSPRVYRNDHSALGASVFPSGSTYYRARDWPETNTFASSWRFGDRGARWLDLVYDPLGDDVADSLLTIAAFGGHPNIVVVNNPRYGIEASDHVTGYPDSFPQPITGTGETEVRACAISPDRKWIAYAGNGGYLIVDTETRWWDWDWDFGNWGLWYTSCHWSSDSQLVAFGSTSATSVEWMNVHDKRTFVPFPTTGRAERIAIHPRLRSDQLVEQ